MVVLGLDVGEKRIGLAKSDALGMFAHGLGYIECDSSNEHFEAISKQVVESAAEKIIVGLPIALDGSEGIAATKIRSFIVQLLEKVSVPVETWDERLSSKEAMRYMQDSSLSGSKKRKRVDSLAAQIILQNYLDSCL
jgi:putative holliday junction resolvase